MINTTTDFSVLAQSLRDVTLEDAPQDGVEKNTYRHKIKLNDHLWYVDLPQDGINNIQVNECYLCTSLFGTVSYCGKRNHLFCAGCVKNMDSKQIICPVCEDSMANRDAYFLMLTRKDIENQVGESLLAFKVICAECNQLVSFLDAEEHALDHKIDTESVNIEEKEPADSIDDTDTPDLPVTGKAEARTRDKKSYLSCTIS